MTTWRGEDKEGGRKGGGDNGRGNKVPGQAALRLPRLPTGIASPQTRRGCPQAAPLCPVALLRSPVRGGVPHLDGAVLTTGDDERQLRVEAHISDVVRVALERLYTRLGLVVPDLDQLVISAGHQVGAVTACLEGVDEGQAMLLQARWGVCRPGDASLSMVGL